MKLNHWVLVAISSCVWLLLGFFLLDLGVERVLHAVHSGATSGLVAWIGMAVGPGEKVALVLVATGFAVGLVKGRLAMRKAVQRGINRILTLPNPTSLFRIYSGKYYILILSMMGMGFLLRFFGVPEEIRGTVLVAVGTALILGGVHCMRSALQIRLAAR
jgi:hypothetical protein